MDNQFRQPKLVSSQQHFSRVPAADIPRSVFNRSHQLKTAADAGFLFPIYVDEVLPGDTFKMRLTTFARMATPLYPFMDNIYADVHFWYVPYRLVWDNWETFISASYEADSETPVGLVVPVVQAVAGQTPQFSSALWDLYGLPYIPADSASFPTVSALPFRAYNKIFNDWYLPSFLTTINEATINTDNGPDPLSDYPMRYRSKRHDYFTSCLPYPQLGPSVTLPLLSTEAPIRGYNRDGAVRDDAVYWQDNAGSPDGFAVTLTGANTMGTTTQGGSGRAKWQQPPGLSEGETSGQGYNYAYLGDAMGTISALREAVQLQRMLERDLRGGTRYIESLKAHFGVTAPDFRLQRAEYLGGGTSMVNQMPVAQTSAPSTDPDIAEETPQGNLAGIGTFSHGGVGFNKSFVEHGVVIGLMSIRADMTYQQNVNKMWSRSTRFDFYWPGLSHLSEEAVLNQEIYFSNVTATDQGVFGYQERYADYRYKPSLVTGDMRSDASASLDAWHLAYDFAAVPTLNSAFIIEDPPVDRVVAVPTARQFIIDCLFDLNCARPMPVYSVPGLMDHF